MLPLNIPSGWIPLSFLTITAVILIVNLNLNVFKIQRYDFHIEFVLQTNLSRVETITIMSLLCGGTVAIDFCGDFLLNGFNEKNYGVVRIFILAFLIIPDFVIICIAERDTAHMSSLLAVVILLQYTGCSSSILVLCNILAPALFSTPRILCIHFCLCYICLAVGVWGLGIPTREPVSISIFAALAVSFGLWGYIVVCGISGLWSRCTLARLKREELSEISTTMYSVVTLLTLGLPPVIGACMFLHKGVEFAGTFFCIMIISLTVFVLVVCKIMTRLCDEVARREPPLQAELFEFVSKEIRRPLSFSVDNLRQLRTNIESGQLEQEMIVASLLHHEAAAVVLHGVASDLTHVSGIIEIAATIHLRRHHFQDLRHWLIQQSLLWSVKGAVGIKLDISCCPKYDRLSMIVDFSKLEIVFRNLVSRWSFSSENTCTDILVTVGFVAMSHYDISVSVHSDHHKTESAFFFPPEHLSTLIPSKPAWSLVACYRWARGQCYRRGSRVQDHPENDKASLDGSANLLEGLYHRGEVVMAVAYTGLSVSEATIRAVLDSPVVSQGRRSLLGTSVMSFEAGLLLSRDIVRHHGGWLSVRSSEQGRSAVMEISIHLFAYDSMDKNVSCPCESKDRQLDDIHPRDSCKQSVECSVPMDSCTQSVEHLVPIAWQSQQLSGTPATTPMVLGPVEGSFTCTPPPSSCLPSHPFFAELPTTQSAPVNSMIMSRFMPKSFQEEHEEEVRVAGQAFCSGRADKTLQQPDTHRGKLTTAICDILPHAPLPASDLLRLLPHGHDAMESLLVGEHEGVLGEEEEVVVGREEVGCWERRRKGVISTEGDVFVPEGEAGMTGEEEKMKRIKKVNQMDKDKKGIAPLISILICDDSELRRDCTRTQLKHVSNSIIAGHVAAARARNLAALITKLGDADCDIDDAQIQAQIQASYCSPSDRFNASSCSPSDGLDEPAEFIIDEVRTPEEVLKVVLDSIRSSSPFQCIFVLWNLHIGPGQHIACVLRSRGYTGLIIGLADISVGEKAAKIDKDFRAWGGNRLLTSQNRHSQIYSVIADLHTTCWGDRKFAQVERQADRNFVKEDGDFDEDNDYNYVKKVMSP